MSKPILHHLGIIMDGNRRWARRRGLPTLYGHKKGYDKVLKVGDWCLEREIKVLTVWAFSTENWNRSKREVAYLMNLLKKALKTEVKILHKKNVKVQILGRLKQLPKGLQEACQEAMKLTKNNTRAILNIAINYGGQSEIIDAVNKMIKDKVKKVTPQLIQNYLYDPKMPSPDLIIRTSGEQRISGFLLWEAPYSELYFCKKHWPAFTERDLDEALADYQMRHRRFGGD